jgi:ribosome-associated toxin RatA of RatAB toxin-antitoxin module
MATLKTEHIFTGTTAEVFAALSNYSAYPKYLPGVTKVEVQKPPSGSKAKAVVRYELNIVKTFHYSLETFEEAPGKIWWHLVDSNLMKENSGSWTLSKKDASHTLAVYELDVKFKGLVPSMVTDPIAKANLPLMFAGFQKMIDESKG